MQQLSLFTQVDTDEWNSDLWQTPANVASLMSKLILPSDRYILEPCAGTGQIAKFLPVGSYANELLWSRYKQGMQSSPSCIWSNEDFLNSDVWECDCFDLIITNPPFSMCVEFIRRSLSLLNPNNPDARLLFLLPLDWNCPIGRATAWSKLDARIHHVYRYKGRVTYLDATGTPQKGRQCSDAVFDIRLGKLGANDTYLEDVCS